jgi:hypothetical protein
MNKRIYYITGIFIIVILSVVYIAHMNRDVKEEIETNLSCICEKMIENFTGEGKIRAKPITGIEGEVPITINSGSNWFVGVVFDSNTTEKEAEEIISKYDIPKPLSIKRGGYPQYYVSASRSDFEVLKNCLVKEEYVQLSNKIKITGENVTAVIWGRSDWILPGLRSSGILLKETMTMDLIYGHETPQTESGKIMQQLDSDGKIINTNVGYLFGEKRS